jgi:2-haloacid dehalogenase
MAVGDFSRFKVLTFDCYGTLIDWERGILDALLPRLRAQGVEADPQKLLERYAVLEADAETGPYLRYAEVLRRVARALFAEFGAEASDEDANAFAASVKDWPPFPDSAEALQKLKKAGRKLAVITNCDEDLFAASAARLGNPFDWVVTAERVGSYKPSPNNFQRALEVIGADKREILHVAQSLYHDIAPARALGFATVWVDRRRGQTGSGATPPAEARSDGIVGSLEELAALLKSKPRVFKGC